MLNDEVLNNSINKSNSDDDSNINEEQPRKQLQKNIDNNKQLENKALRTNNKANSSSKTTKISLLKGSFKSDNNNININILPKIHSNKSSKSIINTSLILNNNNASKVNNINVVTPDIKKSVKILKSVGSVKSLKSLKNLNDDSNEINFKLRYSIDLNSLNNNNIDIENTPNLKKVEKQYSNNIDKIEKLIVENDEKRRLFKDKIEILKEKEDKQNNKQKNKRIILFNKINNDYLNNIDELKKGLNMKGSSISNSNIIMLKTSNKLLK